MDFSTLFPSHMNLIHKSLKNKTDEDKIAIMKENFGFLQMNDETLLKTANEYCELKMPECKPMSDNDILSKVRQPHSNNNYSLMSTYKSNTTPCGLMGLPGIKKDDLKDKFLEIVNNN